MRQCPFDGCKRVVPSDKFSCGTHWYQLNAEERREIWDVYRGWQRGEVSSDQLRARQDTVLAAWRARQGTNAPPAEATAAPLHLTTCKGCGAAIIWARSLQNNLCPLDAEPCEDGTVAIDEDGRAHFLKGDLWEALPSGPRYKSHFATCPRADTFRKPKASR